MDTQTLRALLRARDLSQSEFARRIGVSRQAVSLWLRRKRATLRGDHLLRAAAVLGVRAEDLARPLPCHGPGRARISASLIWDRLHPDLVSFAIDAGRFEPRAVARLVRVYGLFATARMLGDRVWDAFPDLERHLHSARRGPLRTLYEWHRHRTAG